jgi:hypothetical protein
LATWAWPRRSRRPATHKRSLARPCEWW